MVIAVNCRLLLHNKLEGIGRYMHETLQLLVKQNPQHQFVFIFDRPWQHQFIYADNVIPVSVFPQARHPLLYYWWFNFSIPKILEKYNADIFLSPDGYLSLRTSIPQIPIIHDLAFEHFPDGISKSELFYYKTFFPRYAQLARKIITVSEFSKSDIQKLYKIEGSKILVSCNAASQSFKLIDQISVKKVRDKYTAGQPYFLFVGALHPRKNLSNLLLAFDYIKRQYKIPHKLVVVGRAAWKTGPMKDIYNEMQSKSDVVFTGRLSEQELCEVTAAAFVMCYVSLFEGFGIPILEAMQCGVPVITSNTSSMHEVAGDAALVADPISPTQIGEAMLKLINDDTLRANLITKGFERAKIYTWERATKVIEEALSLR